MTPNKQRKLGRILVAGGTGLVGANLTFRLKKMGVEVTASRRSSKRPEFAHYPQYDFCDFKQCLTATQDHDILIICAALSFAAQKNREQPTGTILPNLNITTGLLEAAAQNNLKEVVIISSSTVYQDAEYPIKENELDLSQPPHEAYCAVGTMNRFLEQLAMSYSTIYGIRVVILRPTSIYGPYDCFKDGKSHVIPALIKRALAKESPFEVWGSGAVVRDFVYVEDVVDDIMEALTNKNFPGSTPVNSCSGSPVTISETVKAVLKACNHETTITYDTSKPTAIPYRAVDDSLNRQLFGPQKRTSLAEGLSKTVSWYQKTRN